MSNKPVTLVRERNHRGRGSASLRVRNSDRVPPFENDHTEFVVPKSIPTTFPILPHNSHNGRRRLLLFEPRCISLMHWFRPNLPVKNCPVRQVNCRNASSSPHLHRRYSRRSLTLIVVPVSSLFRSKSFQHTTQNSRIGLLQLPFYGRATLSSSSHICL